MLPGLRRPEPRYIDSYLVTNDTSVMSVSFARAVRLSTLIDCRSNQILAYIRPGKKVADFKYKGGGRQELKRGIGGAGPKSKCAAWIDFVKIAQAFVGEIFIIDKNGVLLVLHHRTESVSKIQQGNSGIFDDVIACAAIPDLSRSFDVGKMPSHMFSGKGQMEGAVIVFK